MSARQKHLFLDAEGTLYVPKDGRTAVEFWLGEHTIERAVRLFKVAEDVAPALQRIQELDIMMHVVSLHKDIILPQLLDELELGNHFEDLLINGDKGIRIRQYAESHGIPLEDCLMVGDRIDLDITPVQNAGIKAILIDRDGEIERDDITIIRSFDELIEHV